MSAQILVVDDNPANLKLAADLLECEGYEVLRAEHAARALTILASAKPDLILMDLSMPGMDGLTLTRQLKADPSTHDIVVVALTASAMKGDEQRVRAAGCDGYISKPIDTRVFPGQVAGYLEPGARRAKGVLVVDDNATNRKLMRTILETEGFEVVDAADGVEALEALGRGRFDAIVSDILMPRMDGYRLCHEVRQSARFRSIPFIFFTSTYTAPGDERLALDMGADGYLTRPAPASALLDALRTVPRKRPAGPRVECKQELALMQEYSQQLVAKLEERNEELTGLSTELKAANLSLRSTLDELQSQMDERKRAEDALQAHAHEVERMNGELNEAKAALEHGMAELSVVNRDLDEFAHVASHDLKEPLRGIHSYASFLLEDYGASFDSNGRHMLEALPRLTTRLDHLIDSLLHFSRVGRIDLECADADLGQVLDEALDALHVTLAQRKIEIRVPRKLPMARCNKTLVGEVFNNLITNASKYNDKDRPWVEIGFEQAPGAEQVYYVRDNGIGIEPKFHDEVFRIFRRLHAREAYGGGSGAGLTITKKIVERHGGRIWLESEPGVGSAFRFTLGEVRP